MAYDEMKVLKDIPIGKEIIRVSSSKDKVDVRKYYTNEKGEWAPGKQGIRFHKENILEVVKALLGEVEADELLDIISEFSDCLEDDTDYTTEEYDTSEEEEFGDEADEESAENLQGFEDMPPC